MLRDMKRTLSELWTEAQTDEKVQEFQQVKTGWDLLGLLAKDRREWLGLDQKDVASYGGPAKTTVSKIERAAETQYSGKTLQQMEAAYGWPRGSIRTSILPAIEQGDWSPEWWFETWASFVEREDPDYLAAPVGPPATSASDLTDDELLAELTYRMKTYGRELGRLTQGESNEAQQESKQGTGSAEGRGAVESGAPNTRAVNKAAQDEPSGGLHMIKGEGHSEDGPKPLFVRGGREVYKSELMDRPHAAYRTEDGGPIPADELLPDSDWSDQDEPHL